METNRVFYAGKLMDLANTVVAVLGFGQLITPQISWPIFVFGFSCYSLFIVLTLWLRRRGK